MYLKYDFRYFKSYDIMNLFCSIGTAQASSGKGQLVASGMDLSGTRSIEGKSKLTKNINKTYSLETKKGKSLTCFKMLTFHELVHRYFTRF